MPANTGRKSEPAALKLIKGRREGQDSGGRKVKMPPGFVRGAPSAPEWLGDVGRAEWQRIVPELERLSLLKEIDRSALGAYCEMVEVFVLATKDVRASGLTVENTSIRKDGTESTWYTANPAVGVQRNAQAAMRAWCSEFGLTPAAEMKLATEVDDGSEESNPFGA